MTKPLLALGAFALLLCLPIAAAHGAPEARAIDTRVVTDNTDFGDYGGEASLPPPFIAPALDLLGLDAREAYGPDGQPGLWLRLITQTDTPEGDHAITLSFDVAGATHTFDLATQDTATWTSTTFQVVGDGVPVGDGHPTAVDAFVSLEQLNATVGDTITAFAATSSVGGSDGDIMPGGYHTALGEMLLPQDGSVTTDLTLAGPAELITLRADADVLTAPGTVNVTASNPTGLEQFIELELTTPDGATATLAAASLLLAPAENRTFEVDVTALGPGDLQVLATSDLWGRAMATVALVGGAATDDTTVSSGLLNASDSFQQVFTTIGTFHYHCHPHPWMQGAVTVIAAPNGSTPAVHTIEILEPGDDPQAWHFSPDDLTIHSGDTVVWINQGASMHDVRGGFGDAGHAGHEHHHEPEEPTPGPGIIVLALGLLIAGRRRA